MVQQFTFAWLEQIDVTSLNADMEKVYNSYPILTTFCWQFEPIASLGDSEDIKDVSDKVLDDSVCWKYASTVRQTTKRIEREIWSALPLLLKKLQSEIEDGSVASEEDVIEFMFGYLQELSEKKITRVNNQRQILIKKNKLSERKDMQYALTIFMRESASAVRYEIEDYALNNFDEFMADFAKESVDTKPIEEPTAPKPSKINPPVRDEKPWEDSDKKAMTWTVLKNEGKWVVLVGDDEKGNPYVWDTSVEESLPLLCIKKTPEHATVPEWLAIDFYNGWGAWEVWLTKSYKWTQITSRVAANKLCVDNLWDGWEFAQFHHNGWWVYGWWHWYAYWNLPVDETRFWVWIKDQAANPWWAGW